MPLSALTRMFAWGPPVPQWEEVAPETLYEVLWAYYTNNDLYRNIQMSLIDRGVASETLKPIRNPAYRCVEFYAAKLWTPDLEYTTDNDRIREPIENVWRWSNWKANRYLAARRFAALGDMFIKVSTRGQERVYFEVLDPKVVTDFDVDERGFLEYARLDVPIVIRAANGTTKNAWHIEVWTKETFRSWTSDDRETNTDRLGPPKEEKSLLDDFGIDFIPIVHAKFRDIGNLRGISAFLPALDKIDEANRMATRMHAILFRHNAPVWALSAGGNDPSGRPLPPPKIGSTVVSETENVLPYGDDTLFRLPGNASLMPMIPQIQYSAALAILQDHMQEIEKDLPELAYYRLREMNTVSGRAVALLLSDASDRVMEARANAENALIRANQMALTIGDNIGVFSDVGTYEAGDFDHVFEERDIFPLTGPEKAEEENLEAQAKTVKKGLGVPNKWLLIELGYTEEEIEDMAADRATENEEAIEQQRRLFDTGEGFPLTNEDEEDAATA